MIDIMELLTAKRALLNYTSDLLDEVKDTEDMRRVDRVMDIVDKINVIIDEEELHVF